MVRASAARKSPPRRQGVLGAAGLLLVAAIAIPDSASRAQTPSPDTATQAADTGSDLLQPKLQGSSRTPPRFRRPGEPTPPRGNQPPPTGKFTASRASARRRSMAVRPLSVQAKLATIPRTKSAARSPRNLQPRPPARPPAHRRSRKRPSPRYRRTRRPRRRRSPAQKSHRRRRRSTRSEPQRGRARHRRRPPSPCR
jgi:hypothetical protein